VNQSARVERFSLSHELTQQHSGEQDKVAGTDFEFN
jgi:hypothetical protein